MYSTSLSKEPINIHPTMQSTYAHALFVCLECHACEHIYHLCTSLFASTVSDSRLWFLVPTTSVLCALLWHVFFLLIGERSKRSYGWCECGVHTRSRDERYRKNIFYIWVSPINAYFILHSKLFRVALEGVWFSGYIADSKNSHIFSRCHMFNLVSKDGQGMRGARF
jgi:hypothetical protein